MNGAVAAPIVDEHGAADSGFYDGLAPYYHLIFPDWSASIARQAAQLGDVIETHWPGT